MTAIDTLARVHPWLPPAQIIALSLSYTLLLPVILALVMDKYFALVGFKPPRAPPPRRGVGARGTKLV